VIIAQSASFVGAAAVEVGRGGLGLDLSTFVGWSVFTAINARRRR
jgi:hypothetical protein